MDISYISNIVGIIGVAFVILGFFLLQINYLTSNSYRYQLLNLFGALFLLFSLCYNWNWPSVIIEILWLMISLYGLIRLTYMRYFVYGAEDTK